MAWLSIILAASLIAISCNSDDTQKEKPQAQQVVHIDPASAPLFPSQKKAVATDFSAKLINGEIFQLSRHKGQVVIINVWATWCSPCHTETPDFVELYKEYADKGLEIIGVSMDEQGKSVVQPFVEKYNVNYPITIDRTGKITDKYGADMGIPTTYIIDPAGHLKYFAIGPLTKKELEPRIRKMLDV